MGNATSVRLAEHTWSEASARFRRDPRLILPVASLMQHGPHLPLATDALITTAIAEGLAERHGVLVAPTLPYGSGSAPDRAYAGSGVVAQRTLHRMLNDLVAAWESQGVQELVLITSNGFGPNYRSLVSVVAGNVRIRAIDTNVIDLSPALGVPQEPERAGDIETSLVLYLAPELVRTDEIADVLVENLAKPIRIDGSEPLPLLGTNGVLGRPSAASADKGQRIYEYLVRYIGDRLFGDDVSGI